VETVKVLVAPGACKEATDDHGARRFLSAAANEQVEVKRDG
jgi:hypothetical protein